jgi:hypothetical protein
VADYRTDDDRARDIIQRLDHLKSIRLKYESAIDECIEFCAPDLMQINQQDSQGVKAGQTVYDGTAISALNLLADGLHGYLVSPAIRWFSLTLPIKMPQMRASGNMRQWGGKSIDEMPDVKEWLEVVEEVMYADFRASNFYETTPTFFRQGGAVGTVSCFLEEDPKTGRLVFFVPHFRECFIAQDRFGRIDTNYRVWPTTNRDLADKFGKEAIQELDPNFIQALKDHPYAERKIIHAIFPRADYDAGKMDNKNMPVASVWMLESGPKKIIRESGFPVSPSITWRWTTNSNEWYGRSPSWFAMVDILKAQQQALSNLKAGHRASDPPYAMLESLRGRANLNAGGRTYLKNMEQVPQILDQGLRGIPIALEFEQATQNAIKEHFHVDFFMLLSQAAFQKVNITATQVIEMQGEKAAVLGTRIGRLQSEFLNPVIDQVFSKESENGAFPPPPDIIYEFQGAKIEVDYVGPLAQAQKRLFKTQNINAALSSLGVFAQVDPTGGLLQEVLDNIDTDITTREILESHGMPAKCIRNDDERRAVREARAQALQAQMVNQGLLDVAKAAPGLGKAPESGSPLDNLGKVMGGAQ